MDQTFTQHLAQVRAQRAELGESMRALEDALALPLGLAVWGRRVRAALTEVAHDVGEHVELTECEGGLYADLAAAAPRLASGIEAQLADHAWLVAEVERLLQARDDGISRADLGAHRDEVTALLQRLVKHRQRGSDLIYEAYEVDIGGSG
ncbi:MAG: hypothetical protein LCH66_05635 [Actinobacteria bacterium]|nr:hypothetical protein [Actinomycetota bacterium]